MREIRRKRDRKTEKNVKEPRIEQTVSSARGFTSCSSSLSSLPSGLLLLLLLLLLLRLLFFVGLRRAADHSYQHNYKLGCRLSVSLTLLHPSRRNTRSLSRTGETFVFVFFFLHLFYLLLLLLPVFLSFVFLPTVDSFYLVAVASAVNPANFHEMLPNPCRTSLTDER